MLIATLIAGAWSAAAQDTETPAGPAPGDAAPVTPVAAQPQEPPAGSSTPDGFRMGVFTFKPGGRVKLDVIRDFQPIDNEDAFDTRTIRVDDDSEGVHANIHAKETRLNLDIRGEVEGHELRMFIETDFYGTSSALRLRHAYGQYNGLLAGQTWSTFMDEDNLPRTIDFESPTAFAMIRQAQVRWTQKFHAMTWSAAVEDNKSSIILPDIPGEAEFPIPDIVGRLRFDIGSGHITTAGFVGGARFRPLGEDTDTVPLWGHMVSANFETVGRDTAYGVFTYGEGIGRYRGGITAVPDENGLLHAVFARGWMAGYEHFWADRWSTNVSASVADATPEPFYPDDFNHRLTYGSVNILYWFLGDRAWTGFEYLYGRREIIRGQLRDGKAHRVQYAVRFNLP